MEECEALCNKIGFMNRGTLIGIGSSQHLKSKLVLQNKVHSVLGRYSTSYMLTFTLTNPSEFSSRYLNSIVTQEFDVSCGASPPDFISLSNLRLLTPWMHLPRLLSISKSQEPINLGVQCSDEPNRSLTDILTRLSFLLEVNCP